MSARFDAEVAAVGARLPPGSRVGVLGSASFWHDDSERTCAAIGRGLAAIDRLVLLTGGISGIGEGVSRPFAAARTADGRPAGVFHVLPRGTGTWDYGTTVHAGDDMHERREILARLAPVYVVLEGGPGTEHEAAVAATTGAVLVPVGRSGGHAGALHPGLAVPRAADLDAWSLLGREDADPDDVAAAAVAVVRACLGSGRGSRADL